MKLQSMIAERLRRLRETLLRNYPSLGEDTDSEQRAFFDCVDGETDEMDKLRALARVIIEAESNAMALGLRQEQIRIRKSRYDNTAKDARAELLECMEALGIKRLPDAEFTATVALGPGGVRITDLSAIPVEFIKLREDNVSKTAIGERLRLGQQIPGAELSNREPRLTLRRA